MSVATGAETIRSAFDRLLEACRPLAAPPGAALAPESPEHARWFTEAVCLWTHFGSAVGGLRVNTLHEEPDWLAAAESDLPADPERIAAVRAALRDTFDWSARELASIEAEVARLVSNLEVKHALTDALARHFEQLEIEHGTHEAALALMRACYGALPLRPVDVDLIVTQTHVYFCLPHANGSLMTPGFERRPAAERDRTEAFVRALERADTPETDRFPAFGLFDPARLDPALVELLHERIDARPELRGIRRAVVVDTLATMLQILPSQLLESYFVHDSFGHGWQETLCEFEWLYARAAHLCDPIGAESGDFLGTRDVPPLSAAFVAREGRTRLDEASLDATVAADLGGRILTGMNGVIAEVLADFADHKLVRTGVHVTSASKLADRPVRFDLIVADVERFAEMWSRSYRTLLERPESRAELVRELRATGLPTTDLAETVDHAVDRIRERFAEHLFTTPVHAAQDPDLAARFLLALATLAGELERHLARNPAVPRSEAWRHPEASIDLICLLLGWFYEQDRARHVWHLADLLRDGLAPTLRRFGDHLRQAPL